jgi:asparagine synthase (glutamine-hydrolysing)
MCGIAGILNLTVATQPHRDELTAMMAKLHHRGPDGRGVYLDGPVGLAHTRLSIIDLAGGEQPIHNEDRTVWVTFNGEIFNYVELRAELITQGHRFYTQSDTEVIVHLYEQHGEKFVDHLNGQFAIALWDTKREKLILARDRTGIRPLFYTTANKRLCFASEVKALFALPDVKRELDAIALSDICTFWSPLVPRSAFKDVLSLPPGHVMTVQAGQINISRYWDWTFPDNGTYETNRSDADYADELRELMIDAVKLQLRADVPVGAYLSGGLDSSITTSLIHHFSSTKLRTFSLTFEDAEFDEREHQQELVKYLGTDHSSLNCTRADIAAAFPRTILHTESPIVRTAPTPLMLLSGHVRASG